MISFSLVPRLFGGGGGEEPGIHCLRMCLIMACWNTCISMGVCKLRSHTKGVCVWRTITQCHVGAALYARMCNHDWTIYDRWLIWWLSCRPCQSSSPSDTTISLLVRQQRLPGRITDLLDALGIFFANANESWSIWKRQQKSSRVSETRLKIHSERLVWREARLSEPSCYDIIKKKWKYTKIYWNDGMSSGLSACANGGYQALFFLLPLRAWVQG